ncbi:MAG: hypothetical protein RMJ56_09215 [Gemmataceae bacterium]|nr:hypothetical protein [Gemmata sp.]MDW8197767.1 hypothetical protein [Gemmataceae bacterium]
MRSLRLHSRVPLILAAALAVVPLGCGGDGITSYSVPKPSRPSGPSGAGEYRLLGLMVPADNPTWFFKYNGPAEEIAQYEADFDKLAASIAWRDGPPEFTVPEGWTRGPGRDGFVKVFATAKPNHGQNELTVTQSGGGVKTNLDRWVGQIGLKPSDDDLAKYTKVVDGKNVKVLRVDLRGPKDPTTKRGPMMP